MLRLQITALDMSTEKSVELGTFALDVPSGSFALTPQVMLAHLPAIQDKSRIGFNAHVRGQETLLSVAGFEYFTLAAFTNSVAQFPLLQVHGASNFFRLNDLQVKRLDSETSNALVCNCVIEEFNIGIATTHERTLRKLSSDPLPVWTDVRWGSIERTRLFVPHSQVNLQESRLRAVRIEPNSGHLARLTIWQECHVRDLSLSGVIGEMRVNGAAIDSLFFAANTSLSSLDIRAGGVANCYGAALDSFSAPTLETARLVISSARNAHDPELLAAASYLYARQHRTLHKTRASRTASLLLDVSCGFGYKPARTAACALAIWFSSSLAYFLLTAFGYGGMTGPSIRTDDLPGLFGRSLYFSATTLTTVGFGDIVPAGWPAMGLACFESALGIVLFALLVFSLSKRFASD
jgi:Ion channel